VHTFASGAATAADGAALGDQKLVVSSQLHDAMTSRSSGCCSCWQHSAVGKPLLAALCIVVCSSKAAAAAVAAVAAGGAVLGYTATCCVKSIASCFE
jgi:hypothetical protein